MSFDILSMIDSEFPEALCPNCCAILRMDYLFAADEPDTFCPVCLLQVPYSMDNWKEYYATSKELLLAGKESKRRKHARKLATIADAYLNNEMTSLDLLLNLLTASKYFVHFSTYSFSTEMIGMMAVTSARIPVRGLIGKSLGNEQKELYKAFTLKTLDAAVRGLDLTFTGQGNSFEETHSKIYVFDGLVALHGSTNLTLKAWLGSSTAHEQLSVETRPAEVRSLNNRFISRFMRRDLTRPGAYQPC